MYTSCGQRLLQVGSDEVLGQGGACVSFGSSGLSIELGLGLVNVMVRHGLPSAAPVLWDGLPGLVRSSERADSDRMCALLDCIWARVNVLGSLLAADGHHLGSTGQPSLIDTRLHLWLSQRLETSVGVLRLIGQQIYTPGCMRRWTDAPSWRHSSIWAPGLSTCTWEPSALPEPAQVNPAQLLKHPLA